MTPRAFGFLALLVSLSSSLLSAQTPQLPPGLRAAYESFEHAEAIRLADSVLTTHDSLPVPLLVECYLVKGISHFSIGEEDAARNSFLEILVLKEDYEPDTIRVSPKIIRFFSVVKGDYERIAARSRTNQAVPPEMVQRPEPPTPDSDQLMKNAMIRSLVLPGWGHLYTSGDAKGWILTSLSAVTLGSMVASIVVTESREQEYLSESDPAQMSENYERYNTSYKIRNGLIIAYAAIFAYAQIDLLFLSGSGNPDTSALSLDVQPVGKIPIRLSFRIPL